MTTHTDTRISAAINDSIREGRAAHLYARIHTQEWVSMANELARVAEDWAPAPTDERREYWGADEDGDEWRIVLHDTTEADYDED